MTLTEFLLARIAEDEVTARGMYDGHLTDAAWFEQMTDAFHELSPGVIEFVMHRPPSRVLAECEAKRQIVEAAGDRLGGPNWRDAIDYAMRELATVYADHPGYREEWKP